MPWSAAGRAEETRGNNALRGLLDAAPIAVVAVTSDGLVAFWNRAAERLFGWKADEVAGQAPPMILPESRAGEAALRHRVLAGNECYRLRGRFRHRDGGDLVLLASSAPQRDAEGSIVGIVSIYEEAGAEAASTAAGAPKIDMPQATARPDAPAPGRGREAPPAAPAITVANIPASNSAGLVARLGLERPSQFLAHVGHDLRQPLHALSLLTSALERRVKDAGTRELVENAGTMVRALQDSFDNILDLARLEEGKVPAQPVDTTADAVLAPLAAEFARSAARRGITFRYVPSSAHIRTDPVLLQRALRHLLNNALRFAARDGRPGRILLGARKRGDRLRLVVADSGIGIPKDQASAVLEPFVQLDAGRASGGLGLGLALAQRLAGLLAAELGLCSAPSKGSRFWIAVDMTTAQTATER
jgi:PAS domain S-box-containing protein